MHEIVGSLDGLDRSFVRRSVGKEPSVVLLTEIPFWEPTYGSHMRIACVLRAIAYACRVNVFSFRTIGPAQSAAFNTLELEANLVSYKNYETKAGDKPVRKNISNWASIEGKAKDGWTHAASKFLHEKKPDFVIIEYADRSYLLDAIPKGTRTILDAHDVMSQRTLTFARVGKSPGITFTAREEAKLLSQYDAVMAISPHDADVMRKVLGLSNVLHVPHPATIAVPTVVRQEARRLLFTGANSEANVSGLKWFLGQVWPLVKTRFELHVVGRVCESVGDGIQGMIKHGVVNDLAGVYAECDMVVNPVFVGGGIKIKTVEAMSYGLPCVTTREGARGLEPAIGSGLIVARQRLEFAGHLMQLAGDLARRRAIAEAARQYVRTHHFPSVAFRDLLLFLKHA